MHLVRLTVILLVCALCCACSTTTATKETTTQAPDKPSGSAGADTLHQADTSKASLPILRFSPSVLVTTPDAAGYVTAKVYIHNDGAGKLMMTDVKGSCGCAGASVQRNGVMSSDSGMIYLQINTKSFTEPSNNVDFTVRSNASNSPTVFRAIINLQKIK